MAVRKKKTASKKATAKKAPAKKAASKKAVAKKKAAAKKAPAKKAAAKKAPVKKAVAKKKTTKKKAPKKVSVRRDIPVKAQRAIQAASDAIWACGLPPHKLLKELHEVLLLRCLAEAEGNYATAAKRFGPSRQSVQQFANSPLRDARWRGYQNGAD